MTKLTLNIIGVAAFGYDFSGNSRPEVEEAFENMKTPPTLFDAFGTTYFPGFQHLPLPYLKKRKAAQKVLFQVVDDVIAHKLQSKRSNTEARDLLDLMLETPDYNMTPEEARVHVMTFMIAGHEVSLFCFSVAVLHF
jgi:cytochrome P450